MSLGAATPSWASIHFKSDLEVSDAIGRAVAGKGHRTGDDRRRAVMPGYWEEGGMITILDLKAEFAKLTLLRGRTARMTEVERKASGGFATLAPFRDGNIFSAKFSGDGAWERHPNGDELVQIVDGAATLHIMTEGGPKSYAVSAGMMVIVPQGTWHRFHSPEGVTLMTATPKPTEHLTVDVEDPRTLTSGQLSNTIEEKWR